MAGRAPYCCCRCPHQSQVTTISSRSLLADGTHPGTTTCLGYPWPEWPLHHYPRWPPPIIHGSATWHIISSPAATLGPNPLATDLSTRLDRSLKISDSRHNGIRKNTLITSPSSLAERSQDLHILHIATVASAYSISPRPHTGLTGCDGSHTSKPG